MKESESYDKIAKTDFYDVSRENIMKFENIKNGYKEYAKNNYDFDIDDYKAKENIYYKKQKNEITLGGMKFENKCSFS